MMRDDDDIDDDDDDDGESYINDDSGSNLRDDGEFGAQVVESDFSNHLVVNEDGSGRSFNDAEQG